MTPDESQIMVIQAQPGTKQIVSAPPGAGKTAVSIERIAWLASQGVAPSAVLMLSFTRTAVQVARDRLRDRPEGDLRAVRMATLDSYAWHVVRQHANAAHVASGDFEDSIRSALIAFDARDGAVQMTLDATFDELKEVIIDEAQDVVGVRRDMLLAFIRRLQERNPQCGISVVGDPCQAIYGWNDDEEREHAGQSLFDNLLHMRGFASHKLTNIYRCAQPNLLHVIKMPRPNLTAEVQGHQPLDSMRELIVNQSNAGTDGWDGCQMILFRRRLEVLCEIAFSQGKPLQDPHRVRLSGMSPGISPVIAMLLRRFDMDVRKPRRKQVLDALTAVCPQGGIGILGSPEQACDRLMASSGTKDRAGVALDLDHLLLRLSSSNPPPEFQEVACGLSGPVLSTIHATKGQEADRVRLVLPHPDRVMPPNADNLEEARVLYVGATRARVALYQIRGRNKTLNGGRTLDGRVYRWGRGTLPRIQIGLDGDVNPLGTWSQDLRTQHNRIQTYLANHAYAGLGRIPVMLRRKQEGWYDIMVTEDQGVIGRTTRAIADFLEKKGIQGGAVLGEPHEGRHSIWLYGARTAVSTDDAGTETAPESVRSSKSWLVPVIVGFPAVQPTNPRTH